MKINRMFVSGLILLVIIKIRFPREKSTYEEVMAHLPAGLEGNIVNEGCNL